MKIEDEFFDVDDALAEMLKEGVLFANGRKYVGLNGEIEQETIVLFVICNDVFGGGADAEPLPYNQVKNLWGLYKINRDYGPIVWVCHQRKEKPDRRVTKKLRELDLWDDEMENFK